MKTNSPLIDSNRLDIVLNSSLRHGLHSAPTKESEAEMCVMEAVAFVAGEGWSDKPACASPTISSLLRSWNDSLPSDEDRDRLLKPLVPGLVGSKASPEIELLRSYMAFDWLVRECTPAFLRLAGLTNHADLIANGPEIIDGDTIDAHTKSLAAARAAAGDAAGDAARDAAWDAAWPAAWSAAWDAARAAARDAAWDAAWNAAWNAAGAAAGAAAGEKLAPTVAELQFSMLALIDRMLAAERTGTSTDGWKIHPNDEVNGRKWDTFTTVAKLKTLLAKRHRWVTKAELHWITQEMESRDSEVYRLGGIIRSYDAAIEQMEGFGKALKRREDPLVGLSSMSEMTSQQVVNSSGIEYEVTFRFRIHD